jgi:hypothetical protein
MAYFLFLFIICLTTTSADYLATVSYQTGLPYNIHTSCLGAPAQYSGILSPACMAMTGKYTQPAYPGAPGTWAYRCINASAYTEQTFANDACSGAPSTTSKPIFGTKAWCAPDIGSTASRTICLPGDFFASAPASGSVSVIFPVSGPEDLCPFPASSPRFTSLTVDASCSATPCQQVGSVYSMGSFCVLQGAPVVFSGFLTDAVSQSPPPTQLASLSLTQQRSATKPPTQPASLSPTLQLSVSKPPTQPPSRSPTQQLSASKPPTQPASLSPTQPGTGSATPPPVPRSMSPSSAGSVGGDAVAAAPSPAPASASDPTPAIAGAAAAGVFVGAACMVAAFAVARRCRGHSGAGAPRADAAAATSDRARTLAGANGVVVDTGVICGDAGGEASKARGASSAASVAARLDPES